MEVETIEEIQQTQPLADVSSSKACFLVTDSEYCAFPQTFHEAETTFITWRSRQQDFVRKFRTHFLYDFIFLSAPPRRRRKQTLMPNFVGLDTHWGDSDDELSDAEFRSDSADFHSPRRAGSGSRASKSKSSRRTPAADGGKPRGQQTPRKSAAAAASGAARKRNRSASKSSVTSRSATPVKGQDSELLQKICLLSC